MGVKDAVLFCRLCALLARLIWREQRWEIFVFALRALCRFLCSSVERRRVRKWFGEITVSVGRLLAPPPAADLTHPLLPRPRPIVGWLAAPPLLLGETITLPVNYGVDFHVLAEQLGLVEQINWLLPVSLPVRGPVSMLVGTTNKSQSTEELFRNLDAYSLRPACPIELLWWWARTRTRAGLSQGEISALVGPTLRPHPLFSSSSGPIFRLGTTVWLTLIQQRDGRISCLLSWRSQEFTRGAGPWEAGEQLLVVRQARPEQ